MISIIYRGEKVEGAIELDYGVYEIVADYFDATIGEILGIWLEDGNVVANPKPEHRHYVTKHNWMGWKEKTIKDKDKNTL